MPLLLEILNNEMDVARESFEEQEVKIMKKNPDDPCLLAGVDDMEKIVVNHQSVHFPISSIPVCICLMRTRMQGYRLKFEMQACKSWKM